LCCAWEMNLNFEEAARRVHLGRSILFTGAGFSFGAQSVCGKPLTDADGLAAELSKEAGEPTALPLDLAAEQYLSNVGDEKNLVTLLQETFYVKSFQSYHFELSRLPWRRIYTTNYDNLIETCLRSGANIRTVATLSDRPSSGLGTGAIVHLNGFIERISSTNWNIDTILTTGQYLTDKFRISPWAEVFRTDLSMSDAVFFMGYSLYDLDVSRILYENPDVIQKTFFIVGDSAKRETILKASRLGVVISRNVGDVSALFPRVGEPDVLTPSPFTAALSRFEVTPALTVPDTR
jgi:hypothetical protein